jgi:hypothetical protein
MTVRMTRLNSLAACAVLEKTRQGAEVIIERGNRPVVVLKAPQGTGRKISDVIAAPEASGAGAAIDEDFARDVEDGIKSHWDRGKLDLSEAFIDASFSSARKGAPPSAARLSPWLCSSITSGGF